MYKFNPNFYADVRIEDRYETTVNYKNKVFEAYKVRNEKRAFIRVFDGSMWYYTSTSEPSEIQSELDKLYLQGTPNVNIAENETVKRFQVNREECFRFTESSVRKVDKSRKTAIITGFFNDLDSEYIKYTNCAYLDRNSVYEFYSSKGAAVKYDFQICGISVMFGLANGEENFINAYSRSGSTVSELEGKLDGFREYLDESIDYLLNAKPCEKGDFPVVLAPVVAGVFAHESFGHKSEADFMLGDENACKEWAIGKKIASDILTIVDSGVDFGSGYVPFDDEGTRAGKTYLIKDGVLSGRLHSAGSAAYLGEEVTGNARAINCKFEPIVRMTNTYIEEGNSTLEELIGGIKKGYFIKGLNHGSGLSKFTIAPSLCYEIIDGKIGQPVKISVLTGDVFETLGLIDGLSNKKELLSFVTGGCGKNEQYPLTVGFGGPYVRIKKINVQ